MQRERLQEIISDASLQGAEHLEDFIRRADIIDPAEAARAVEHARAVIEGIPGLLEAVERAAATRGIALVVQPLLDHAAEYFIDPADHASEVAFGMTGLLDDAYLALRIVHLVQQVYHPLVPADVEGQLEFLRDLLGADLVAALDAETGRAVLKMAMAVAALRERTQLDSAPLPAPPHP